MYRTFILSFISLSIILVSSCSGESSSNKEVDYEATKKMVVDIFQTEDGKKAFEEIMTDGEMQKKLVIESDVVKDSITDTLASEKGMQMWTKLFNDPEFVEGYAKSMAEEQKKLMKELMNDADFQKQMLDLLQNPEITEQMLGIMKSQQFRSHLEETIQETLETPLFQAKIQDILIKAAEKKGQSEKEAGKDENKDKE